MCYICLYKWLTIHIKHIKFCRTKLYDIAKDEVAKYHVFRGTFFLIVYLNNCKKTMKNSKETFENQGTCNLMQISVSYLSLYREINQ